MRSVLISAFLTFRGLIRSRIALHLEVLALHHQPQVLQRSHSHRLALGKVDRCLWIWLSRVWANWRTALVIVQPETVIAWHRRGFRLFWAWKSRRRIGRPPVPSDVRDLIQTMSQDNPLWGAPRIHGELLKLGVAVSQATVAEYMARSSPSPSQSWRTFLANHVQPNRRRRFLCRPDCHLPTVVCPGDPRARAPSNHARRRHAHPTAAWTAQQFREAFPWNETPCDLVRDRDSAFHGWATTVTAMEIHEVVTAPRSPWQNAYAERLIGSIRRECLDQVIVWNARGLRRVLNAYVAYYHRSRTHLSLDRDSPVPRETAAPSAGRVVAIPQVGGLHHRYERRAA